MFYEIGNSSHFSLLLTESSRVGMIPPTGSASRLWRNSFISYIEIEGHTSDAQSSFPNRVHRETQEKDGNASNVSNHIS